MIFWVFLKFFPPKIQIKSIETLNFSLTAIVLFHNKTNNVEYVQLNDSYNLFSSLFTFFSYQNLIYLW